MQAFVKELLSRLPSWVIAAIVFFALGFLCAIYFTGRTFTFAGERYGVVQGATAEHVSVRVLSNDHQNDQKNGETGRYFNFDADLISGAIGGSDWDELKFHVLNTRTGKSGLAVIWNANRGGSVGSAHGRFDLWSLGDKQWKVGDVALFTIAFSSSD